MVKNLPATQEIVIQYNAACNIAGAGSIHGSEISLGGEHGNPLQYSCLGNPVDRGIWRGMVLGVTQRQT